MKCTIVDPFSLIFDAEVKYLVLPAWDGSIGIELNHAPLMTVLKKGNVTVYFSDSQKKDIYISGGFANVKNNLVSISVFPDRVNKK